MIRLGNIDYSNCYPIHGPLLGRPRPDWLQVVDGPPAELNRGLAAGELDVAPGSSIELARHAREYRALGGLCIGSDGPVHSIVAVSGVPLGELGGRTVALPTASASSRCLLRILLELRLGVSPSWVDFDQSGVDPMAGSGPGRADAALFIGDVALRRADREGELRFDLGREWTEWTGLPFVYALWMVRDEVAEVEEMQMLHRRLLACRDALPGAFRSLASPASARFGLPADRLGQYWTRIRYGLDSAMLRGLKHFLDLATHLDEAPAAPELRFVP